MDRSKRRYEFVDTLNGVDPRIRQLFLALDHGDERLREYARVCLERELPGHHSQESVLGKILIPMLAQYRTEPDTVDHPLTLLWNRFRKHPSYAVKLLLVGVEYGGEIICLHALSVLPTEPSLARLGADDMGIIIERIGNLLAPEYLQSLQMAALLALNQFQHPAIRQYCVQALGSELSHVRHLAALALETQADESVALDMVRFLDDPVDAVALSLLLRLSRLDYSDADILQRVLLGATMASQRFSTLPAARNCLTTLSRKQLRA